MPKHYVSYGNNAMNLKDIENLPSAEIMNEETPREFALEMLDEAIVKMKEKLGKEARVIYVSYSLKRVLNKIAAAGMKVSMNSGDLLGVDVTSYGSPETGTVVQIVPSFAVPTDSFYVLSEHTRNEEIFEVEVGVTAIIVFKGIQYSS